MKTAEQRVKKALKKVGKTNGLGMCQQEQRLLWGLPPSGDFRQDGDFDAIDAWKAAKSAGKVVKTSSAKKIPRGALVYWEKIGGGHGHVATSYATGRVVSTDWGGVVSAKKGKWAKGRIADISSKWGLRLVGYVVVAWNDEKIFDPPPPKVRPPEPPLGAYEVVKTPSKHKTCLAREKPSRAGGANVGRRRKKGFNVQIRHVKFADGLWWGQARKLWYPMRNMRKIG